MHEIELDLHQAVGGGLKHMACERSSSQGVVASLTRTTWQISRLTYNPQHFTGLTSNYNDDHDHHNDYHHLHHQSDHLTICLQQ